MRLVYSEFDKNVLVRRGNRVSRYLVRNGNLLTWGVTATSDATSGDWVDRLDAVAGLFFCFSLVTVTVLQRGLRSLPGHDNLAADRCIPRMKVVLH